MAETFDCPKCGAPINYEPDQHLDQQTMSCPYCGESVIIPTDLRRTSPPVTPVNTVVVTEVSRRPNGFLIVGCAAVFIILAIILFTVTSLKGAFLKASVVSTPTSPEVAVQNILATVGSITSNLKATMEITTPTPSESSTPTLDTTATAQVANNILIEQQSNWPVLMQEKFVNNQRNWNIGTDNTDLALEEYSIAGGKYTWKITSKKGMGTFSFPDMPVQTDLYVSADILMTTTIANPADQAGIIFRNSAKDNTFYFFGVNPVGSYSLTMYDGSNWSDLISTNQTDQLRPNEVNHLAVSMQGDQILLVINNVVIDSYQDTQLASGDAGLGIYLDAAGEDATIIFSNFYVRTPKK
jgi:hypothetical protein